MKKRAAPLALAALLFLTTALLPAHAAHVSRQQAEDAARNWLARSAAPLGEEGGTLWSVEMYGEGEADIESDAEALFYVAHVDPAGLIMMPAEDLLEPIYAFIPESDEYWADGDDVLHGIVAADLCGKVRIARAHAPMIDGETRSQKKWRVLANGEKPEGDFDLAKTEMRVPPLLSTRWGQDYPEDDEDFHVFSYYTPRNYPAGCTATAMAQVMKFFGHPREGIGAKVFEISVNGRWRRAWTRGGDGKGGPYDWANMPDAPDARTSLAERKSLGALLYDVGVAIGSEYEREVTYGFVGDVAIQLVKTFRYGNAIGASLEKGIDLESAALAINPNLDAGIPLPVGIYCQSGPEGDGHALVCDGYAYDMGTLYYHFNLGMDGLDDLWIAMPDDWLTGEARLIDEIAYNIYPGKKRGEIVSGRVLDEAGKPLADIDVRIEARGFAETTRSNERGIFAFTGVPSNRAFEVRAERDGEIFATVTARTGKSASTYYEEGVEEMAVGNVWGVLLQRE